MLKGLIVTGEISSVELEKRVKDLLKRSHNYIDYEIIKFPETKKSDMMVAKWYITEFLQNRDKNFIIITYNRTLLAMNYFLKTYMSLSDDDKKILDSKYVVKSSGKGIFEDFVKNNSNIEFQAVDYPTLNNQIDYNIINLDDEKCYITNVIKTNTDYENDLSTLLHLLNNGRMTEGYKDFIREI
ncbi:MAG: hypothetical protein U9Q66_02095 [Patescibacteria group bacterium]|nr:hypothetical protein [Patescibacteria group bacterium]